MGRKHEDSNADLVFALKKVSLHLMHTYITSAGVCEVDTCLSDKAGGYSRELGAPRTGGLPTALPPCVSICELQARVPSDGASRMISFTFNSQRGL